MRFSLDASGWHVRLQPGELHLWPVALEAPLESYGRLWGVLSPSESAQAASFRFERDRLRFAAARGALRFLLGAYIEKDPQEIEFRHRAKGKPFVANGDARIEFNMAHSDGQALYAICADCQIGVDIERIRPLDDLLIIAQEFFALEEYLSLAGAPEQARPELFFRYWTLKEAVVKATGEGIGQVQDFRLHLADNGDAVLEPMTSDEPWDRIWELKWFQPKEGYAGALAASGAIRDVRLRASIEVSELVALLARRE